MGSGRDSYRCDDEGYSEEFCRELIRRIQETVGLGGYRLELVFSTEEKPYHMEITPFVDPHHFQLEVTPGIRKKPLRAFIASVCHEMVHVATSCYDVVADSLVAPLSDDAKKVAQRAINDAAENVAYRLGPIIGHLLAEKIVTPPTKKKRGSPRKQKTSKRSPQKKKR
jgi:hypothetical protein